MCGILAILMGLSLKEDDGGGDPAVAEERGSGEPSSSSSHGSSEADIVESAQWWLRSRGPDGLGLERRKVAGEEIEVVLSASLLQVRGKRELGRPTLSDEAGNVLAFNGEIYSGLSAGEDENDGAALLTALGRCEGAQVAQVLSGLRGPWSVCYWREDAQTLWYGRDVIGRRSLLRFVNDRPDDPYVVLSSVVSVPPRESARRAPRRKWTEVPPGIYSIDLGGGRARGGSALARRHDWTDPIPKALASRASASAIPETSLGLGQEAPCDRDSSEVEAHAEALFDLLRESVRMRCRSIFHKRPPSCEDEALPPARVAVLFSGGLDSAILAALAGTVEPESNPIDLINVCFYDGRSPDREAALECLAELAEANVSRNFRLICVNSSLEAVDALRHTLVQLLHPAETFMDLNIGAALSIGATCRGRVLGYDGGEESGYRVLSEDYVSRAKVILMGQGADEQTGGYGRHKTKFRSGGWPALAREIEMDVERLWHRNLGRDDRCVSHQGREPRFPFLDEGVALALRAMPLPVKCDPSKPLGVGDKRVLRFLAKRYLKLDKASQRPKRAIQFGSRIAKLSNMRDFGSNRAANSASAGSVVLPELS